MRKIFSVVFLLAVILTLFQPEIVSANATPEIRVVSFDVQAQWLTLETYNSGEIILELNTHGLPFPGTGEMNILNREGVSYKMRNMWVETAPGIYRWEMYLYDVSAFWMNDKTVSWIPYGPLYLLDDSNGFGITPRTKVTFTVLDPEYRPWEGIGDPTWDWRYVVTPSWAASAYKADVRITMDTNCEGLGDNHGGNFYWETPLEETQVFGNGIPRPFVAQPLVHINWRLTQLSGEVLAEGSSLGPSCVQLNKTYLPTVVR